MIGMECGKWKGMAGFSFLQLLATMILFVFFASSFACVLARLSRVFRLDYPRLISVSSLVDVVSEEKRTKKHRERQDDEEFFFFPLGRRTKDDDDDNEPSDLDLLSLLSLSPRLLSLFFFSLLQSSRTRSGPQHEADAEATEEEEATTTALETSTALLLPASSRSPDPPGAPPPSTEVRLLLPLLLARRSQSGSTWPPTAPSRAPTLPRAC